jgi:hypothetical protein
MKILRDRTALITGAASGIGRATAIALAAEGCRLALVDRDAAGLASLAEALAMGPQLTVHVVDVADRAAHLRLRDEVLAAHEELHLRPRLVLDLFERDAANLLGPCLERHHSTGDGTGLGSRRAKVVDVDAQRDREDVRRARHVQDDVDEEDLEHAGHAAGAKVSSQMAVQM